MEKTTLALGSFNKNKIAELTALLKDYPVIIKSPADFASTSDPEETEDTFEGNALLKARYYANQLGIPALADDSGLCVETLDNQPGVFSARWAGESATDASRCALILEKLKGENRRAFFMCALVLALPSGGHKTWIGKCEGEISLKPKGDNGFGYDPIFYYPALDKTFAQMSGSEKGTVSHRGRALAQLTADFNDTLEWIKSGEGR